MGSNKVWQPPTLQWAKRHPDQPWFALNAATVQCVPKPEVHQECGETSEVEKERFWLFNSEKPSERVFNLAIKEEGHLVFYVNDAVPFGWRHFYGNNSGQIWLIVLLLDREAQ